MPTEIYLREIERTDLPNINQWRNDPDIVDLLGANFLFIGAGVEERWFDNYLTTRDKTVRLAIVESGTDIHIGNVNLTAIHSVNRSAEFSIFIGNKAYWSAGCGSLAARKMLTHGFNNLNLHRIYLTLLLSNERAKRMYQRLGFREEGCQRQATFKNGNYHDVLSMALLKDEFISNMQAL